MKLSLVIPCYNEGQNIPTLIERLEKVFGSDQHEVILVDNGSTDNTNELIEKLTKKINFIKFHRVEKNIGYGNGILEGLKIARGDFIGWTHADLQTDPKDSLKAIEMIKNNKEKIFFKGLRRSRKMSDNFFTFSMSIFEFLILGKLMWDINAQPTIFSRELFENWKNAPYDFSLDLFAFYEAKSNKYKIKRFPVFFPDRIYGKSHWNIDFKSKLKFIKSTLDFSFKLRNKLK